MSLETKSPDTAEPAEKKRRRGQPVAKPWELICLCGQKLTGVRTESPQTIICEHCDREHFVLPVNRYPAPKSRRRKRKKRAEPLSVTIRRQLNSAAKLAGQLLALAATQLRRQLVRTVVAIRNWLTPLRSAVLALTITVLVGGLFAFNQHRQQSALSTLRTAVTAGETALEEQNWAAATSAYSEASQAVAILGRDDEFARDIQQKNRELQAIADLCTLSLEDMIDEASGKRRVSRNWQNTFKSLVQGRYLVTECWLVKRVAAQNESEEDAGDNDKVVSEEIRLAYPLPVSGELVDFRWPVELLHDWPVSAGESLHVACAGKIQTVEPPTRHGAPWVITMESESSFLWQSEETCAAVGFELENLWMPQDSLKDVLTRQRDAAGREE